jgi:hypothetical protein
MLKRLWYRLCGQPVKLAPYVIHPRGESLRSLPCPNWVKTQSIPVLRPISPLAAWQRAFDRSDPAGVFLIPRQ